MEPSIRGKNNPPHHFLNFLIWNVYLATSNVEEAIFSHFSFYSSQREKWLWLLVGKNNQYPATKTSVSTIEVGYQPVITFIISSYWMFIINGLPTWFSGVESACQCMRCWFDPWVRKIPLRRKWQSTPVFLPGESHGQRSLAGYGPEGCRELDPTGLLSIYACIYYIHV